MRIRDWTCLAVLLAFAGTAGAEDKYRFFPRKERPAKSESAQANVVRPISFGPEFGDEKPVPRAGTKSKRVALNLSDPPLLLGPAAAGEAFRLAPPPEPTPVLQAAPDGLPAPGPVTEGELLPMPGDVVAGPSVSLLYSNVRYKDLKNVHPCAVPIVVAVADPCGSCGCVYVQICVPPNCCPKVKTGHGGREVEYRYGKYEVEIKSKGGCVEVDYDD